MFIQNAALCSVLNDAYNSNLATIYIYKTFLSIYCKYILSPKVLSDNHASLHYVDNYERKQYLLNNNYMLMIACK